MNKDNVISFENRELFEDPLTDLIRTGARQLITLGVEAELDELMAKYDGQHTETGHRAVVRSGYHRQRQIQTGIGSVTVKIPKVRSTTGEPVTFRSCLIPPYVRKTRTLEAFVPWLYLKGISSGEMGDVLGVLLGQEAKGFSAAVVSRLKAEWEEEREQWMARDLSRERWVYLWVDGIYSGLRNEDVKLCSLVVIGVNDQGEKKLLTIEDGVRESTQSWREVLLDLKARGMNVPKLAVGDGALGFWSALDEIYPDTRHQRCWVHKSANVLNALPKSAQPKAKEALREIWMAETRSDAQRAFDQFIDTYQDKYPKATECLEKDREELLAFYDFPAVHWQSLRTTNPIESTFATIRHRTRRSKGCLSRKGMLCMMFKLGLCAQHNWRRLRGFRQLGKVIEGIQFKDGIETKQFDNQVAA